MSDKQLIEFAKLESQNLPLASFHALKDELISRNIPLNIIEEDSESEKINKLRANPDFIISLNFIHSLQEFCVEELRAGSKKQDLFQGLLKKGIGPDQAFMLLAGMDDNLKAKIKQADNAILSYSLVTVIFLLVALFSFSENMAYFLVGCASIIISLARIANESVKKSRYSDALDLLTKSDDKLPLSLYQ